MTSSNRTALPGIAWLLVCVLLVAGCSKSAPELLEAARRAEAGGDIASALIHMKNAVARAPEDGTLRFMLAELHNRSRDGASAETELRRALERRVLLGGRVSAELARALILQEQFQKALDDVQPSEAFEPDALVAVIALRGRAALLLGRTDEARKLQADAARLKADAPDVMYLAALIKATGQDAKEPLAAAEAMLAVHPRNIDALMLKADMLRFLGRGDETMATYDTILKLQSGFIPAHVARTSLLIQKGDLVQAQKGVDGLRKLVRVSPATSYLQGLIHLRNSKFQESLAAALDTLKYSPGYGPAILLAGTNHFALGSYAQAERMLTQYVSAAPNEELPRRLLAAALVKLREGARALETIEPVVAAGVDTKGVLAIAGEASLVAGDFARANEFLTRAVAAEPRDARLRTRLAVGRMGTGDLDGAVSELEKAAASEGADARTDYLLVIAELRRNELDRALAAARRATEKHAKDPVAHDLLGTVLVRRKDIPGARKSFERALEISPSFFPALANLARLDLGEKKPEVARKRFEDAVKRDPRFAEAMMGLARLAADAGKHPDAVAWLEKAVAAKPAFVEPRVQLAGFYLREGQARKALEMIREAERVAPLSADVLSMLARTQIANGEANTALATLQRLTSVAPGNPEAHYELAVVRALLNDLRGAEASLKTALGLRADYPAAIETLSRIYAQTNRAGDAVKLAKNVQTRMPKSPMGVVLEADMLMQQGRYAEAVKLYEQAYQAMPAGALVVRLYTAHVRAGQPSVGDAKLVEWLRKNPEDLMVRAYHADALAQTGRVRDAIAEYETIDRKSPGNYVILNNLAGLYHEQKDRRALELAERAHKLAPDDPHVADTLGWILLAQDPRSERAFELLRKAASVLTDNGSVRYHYAVALSRRGERKAALGEVEAALALKAPFASRSAAEQLRAELRGG